MKPDITQLYIMGAGVRITLWYKQVIIFFFIRFFGGDFQWDFQ